MIGEEGEKEGRGKEESLLTASSLQPIQEGDHRGGEDDTEPKRKDRSHQQLIIQVKYIYIYL